MNSTLHLELAVTKPVGGDQLSLAFNYWRQLDICQKKMTIKELKCLKLSLQWALCALLPRHLDPQVPILLLNDKFHRRLKLQLYLFNRYKMKIC